MSRLTRTDALVAVQFLAIGAIALWPRAAQWSLPGAVRAAALTGATAGGVLGAAGLIALGRDLTPFVAPRAGARLRTGGVYRFSRNPIYTGLLLMMLGLAVLRARPEPLVAAAVLATVLHLKSGAEERYLRERFGAEYERYAARVPRLLGRAVHTR